MGIFRKWTQSENREVYYIDYYDEHGKRQRESTGSGSRTFAKEVLTRRKDEVAQRKKLPDRYIARTLFSDFVDNEYLKIPARASRYEANIKGICKKLKNAFGDKGLAEITSQMVEIYKKERLEKGVAENTINNELNTLSGIFTKAIE